MRVKMVDLTKKFKDTVAVNHFNLILEEGELTALLGPSGCGKSTTLNMLAGILPATTGKIYFDDTDITDMPPQDRGIGLVFQNYALYPHMTVLENICFPLEIQKVAKKERVKKAIEMAKLIKIEEYLYRRPKELSGGQQQRVAIARALIKKPRLLLLDEPLSNLDARLRLSMREEIRRIQQQTKITTVFVTHDQEEAMSVADKIVLMQAGNKIQEAKPQDLYYEPINIFAANFIGNPPINSIKGSIDNGYFYSTDGSCCIRLSDRVGQQHAKVILGLRAESVVYDENDVDCRALVVDRFTIGKEELAHLRIGSCDIRVYLPDEVAALPGSSIPLRLRRRGVFVFDEVSGERLL